MRVENKRHTNAHQPLTSPSPHGGFNPPLSAIAKIISKYAGICVLLLFFYAVADLT